MGTSVDNRSTKVDRKVVTESAERNLKRLVTVRIKDQLETNMALLFIGTLHALGFDMLAVYEGNIIYEISNCRLESQIFPVKLIGKIGSYHYLSLSTNSIQIP